MSLNCRWRESGVKFGWLGCIGRCLAWLKNCPDRDIVIPKDIAGANYA
ncbi:hypothetical protein ACFLYF_03005 [Chloroflexota bacterium]